MSNEAQKGIHAMTTVVRKKRIKLGITESAAAAKAKIHFTSWSRYETGRQRPTRPVAERMAMALASSVAELWPEGVKELGGVMLDASDAVGGATADTSQQIGGAK